MDRSRAQPMDLLLNQILPERVSRWAHLESHRCLPRETAMHLSLHWRIRSQLCYYPICHLMVAMNRHCRMSDQVWRIAKSRYCVYQMQHRTLEIELTVQHSS